MKIKPLAAGLALGVFWGVILFVLTIVSHYTGYLSSHLNLLIGIYPFYEISLVGAIAGLIDGLIDGFVGGLVLALLYNAFAGVCCKKSK